MSQPLIANIHGLKEVKEGGEVEMEEIWNMEEGNQQDSLLRVNREVGDPPEGRVKFEGASQGYEFSSEESEGEETNREVEDDPPDSSSPEGRVKIEGASQGYEFSSEESEGEETNREVEDDPPDSSSPEGRVKFEGASQGYEFSSEESEGEENNREVRDDPLETSSSEGRVKSEGASRVNESSSEESIGEENNRDKRDTDESIEEEEKGGEDNIGTCVTDEEEDGAVTVLKLSNGVMFRVPVEVQGMQLQAVVDTAAQVTLVSEEFYKSLDPAPPIRKEVVMNTAGKGMQMNGYIAGPFQVVLGTHLFTVENYVAPIEEDMLLGLDFLEANGVSLHLKEKELQIAGDVIPMRLGTGSPLVNEKEAGVFLAKGCNVPPNSVMRVGAQLSESMAGEYIVKAATKGELLIPRTLHNGGDNPVLCLINISDHYVEVEKGEVLAYAEEVCSNVETIGVQKVEVAEKVGPENGKREIPEHLTNLFDKSKGELNEQEQTQLSELLCEFEDVFAKSEFDLGKFNTIQHGIDTGTNRPVKQRIRRTPFGFAGEEEAQLKKMLSAGVIRPSVSEWASAPVLIRKRCGSVRWCVDYRALNALTIKDVFPLPLVDECLDTLAGNVWYSKLDANSAYWQVKIKPEDCSKTAFITKYGLFEFARMAFGLCNSPATYTRVINLVLRGLNWKVVLAFLDDILVLGKDFEGHLANLRAVLVRFREYGLKLKPKKCELFQKEVEFLGRVVGPRGIYIGPGYIKDIKN